MKKFCTIFILSSLICIISSSCTQQQKQSLIQSKRRFAEYVESQNTNNGSHIDLSEGPKLRYDANFGPKAPSFEIKIIDPY